MDDLTIRTLAPLITATTTKLGAELPSKVREGLAVADRLRTAAREGVASASPLGVAVGDAVLAGRDPLTSKEVQRALMAQQLISANIDVALINLAHRKAAEVIVEHADDVLSTWRPVVEKADQALHEFRTVAPGADLADDTVTRQLPAVALTPWGRAREAVALLVQLEKGYSALAAAVGTQVPHLGGRPLMVADLTLEQAEALGQNAHADAVASLDVPLDLADISTYRERIARLGEQMQGRAEYEANAPERAREERRQQFAIRIPHGALR